MDYLEIWCGDPILVPLGTHDTVLQISMAEGSCSVSKKAARSHAKLCQNLPFVSQPSASHPDAGSSNVNAAVVVKQ